MPSKVIIPVCSYPSHIEEATESVLIRLWCKEHYICARCIFLYTITDSHSPILTCCKCKNQIPEPTDRSKPKYTIARAGNDCALVTANAIIHRFRDAYSRDFITHHPEMCRIVESFRTFEDGMEYDMMEILQALAEREFYHTNCMIWHLDNTSNEVVIPDDALTILVKSPQHFYAYIKKGPDQWRLFDSTFDHLRRFVSFQELKILLEPFMDSKYNTAAVAIVNRQPCAVNNSSCDPIASKARICGKHLVCSRCDEDDSKRAYCNEDKRFYCNICTHKDISYDGITDEDQILALLCATSEDNYDDAIPCGFDSISGSRDTAEDKTMIGMRSISVDKGLDTFVNSKLEGINELSGIPSTDTADGSNPCNRSIDISAVAVRNSPKPTPMMKFMKRPKITISARKPIVPEDKDIVTTIKSLPWPLMIKIDSETSSLSSSSSVVVRGKHSPNNNYQSLLSASVPTRTRSSTTEEMKPPPVFIRRPKLATSVSITSTGGTTTDSGGTDGRSSPFINMDRLHVNDDTNNRLSILPPQSTDTISPEHPITTGSSSSRSISSTSNRRKFEKRPVLETRMSSPLLWSSLSSDLQAQTADDLTSNDMSSRSASSSQGNEEIVSQSSQDTFKRSMSSSLSSSALRPQSVPAHTNQKVLGLRIPPRPPSYHRRTTSIDSLENSSSLLTDSSSSPLNDDEYGRGRTRVASDHIFVPPCCHAKHISPPSEEGVSYILLWCGRHYLCSRCIMLHDAPDSHSVLLHCYQCQIHSPVAIDRSKPMFTVPRSMNDSCLVTANAIIDQCREMDSRRYITPEHMHEVIRKNNQSDGNDIIVEYTMSEVLAAMLCRDFDSVSLRHSRSNDDGDNDSDGDALLVDIPESAVSILIQSSKLFYAYLKVESDKWRLFDPSFQLENAYLLSKELPLVLRPVLKGSPDNQIVAITNRDLSIGK